jgi:hypothetical protein
MAKITNLILRGYANDIPDDILTQLTAETSSTEVLERRLPEILRLGLSAGKLPADVYHYVLNFLISNPTSTQIIEFRPTLSMQTRLKDLLSKSKAGQLSLNEQQELNEYERIEHLIVMLKTGSLRYLTLEQ